MNGQTIGIDYEGFAEIKGEIEALVNKINDNFNKIDSEFSKIIDSGIWSGKAENNFYLKYKDNLSEEYKKQTEEFTDMINFLQKVLDSYQSVDVGTKVN